MLRSRFECLISMTLLRGDAAADPRHTEPHAAHRARVGPRRAGGQRKRQQPDGQGLTYVHIFAQPELFMSLKPIEHHITCVKKCSR